MQAGFRQYLQANKKMLLVALSIATACYAILRILFPMPDFFADSLSYISWARLNTPVQYRPTGYSTFLRFIREYISQSDSAVVLIQYLLFVLAGLFCFTSIDYLFGLKKKVKWPLLVLLIVNPILIFQTNMIMSDSIFCSLTVIWFSLCLWAMRTQKWGFLALQIAVLYVTFCIRYTAMFYPAIGVTVFALFTTRTFYRIAGTFLTIIVIMTAVYQQQNAVEHDTGVRVFSGFSGWQLANNVLYYYKRLDIDTNAFPSLELKNIDKTVKLYIDSVVKKDSIGSVYMWDRKSPLKVVQYTYMRMSRQRYFPQWFATSVALNEYATYLIKRDPGAFLKYFILPNTRNFFYPEHELLEKYDVGNTKLDRFAKEWFGYETDVLYCRFPGFEKNVMRFYPALSFILNILNIGTILLFFVRLIRNWKRTALSVKGMFFGWSIFYFGYMAFSISATVVTLRYMDPLYVLGLAMPAFLIFYKPGESEAITDIPEPSDTIPVNTEPAAIAHKQASTKRSKKR